MIGKVLLNEISSFVNRGSATQAVPQKVTMPPKENPPISKRR